MSSRPFPAGPGGTPGVSSTAMLITGAVVTGPSSTFIAAAHVSASAAASYRCVYAAPALGVLATLEARRHGRRHPGERLLALAAGTFLGLDLVLWAHSIAGLGAGIATVVSNLQVFPVSLMAWLLLGERPGRRLLLAAPAAVLGLFLLAGLAGTSPAAPDPAAALAPAKEHQEDGEGKG